MCCRRGIRGQATSQDGQDASKKLSVLNIHHRQPGKMPQAGNEMKLPHVIHTLINSANLLHLATLSLSALSYAIFS